MFDGSITVHWADALPVPRNRLRAIRGIKNLICFILNFGFKWLSYFSGTAGDYLYCRVEQHERKGKEGDESDADSKKYRPDNIECFHHR